MKKYVYVTFTFQNYSWHVKIDKNIHFTYNIVIVKLWNVKRMCFFKNVQDKKINIKKE